MILIRNNHQVGQISSVQRGKNTIEYHGARKRSQSGPFTTNIANYEVSGVSAGYNPIRAAGMRFSVE